MLVEKTENSVVDQKRSRATIYMNKYLSKHPWVRTYTNVISRCNCPSKKYYYGKGIKNYLKTKDFKFLWYRDKAYLINRPSIHRIDSSKNYTIDNCRYIELIDNIKRKKGSRLTQEQRNNVSIGTRKHCVRMILKRDNKGRIITSRVEKRFSHRHC